jgi:hypothetical protein
LVEVSVAIDRRQKLSVIKEREDFSAANSLHDLGLFVAEVNINKTTGPCCGHVNTEKHQNIKEKKCDLS